MTRKNWLLLFGLSLPWGCSFFFFKVLGTELPPATIALGRVAIAAVALIVGVAASGLDTGPLRRHWRGLLLLGLLNNALPFTLFAYGETVVSSGTAAIFNALAPMLTALVLRGVDGVRLGWNKLLGIVIGFAGVVVLAGGGDLVSAPGEVACFLAALCYGFSAPVMARLRHLPPLLVACAQLTASTILLAPAVALFEQPWALPMPSGETWAALAGLALFSTAFAYVLYFRLVSSAGPANAMLVTYILPVTALILGNVALGEAITSRAVAGMAVILLGLAVLDGRWLKGHLRPA